MTEPSTVASEYVRAVADPWRLRILAALEGRTRSAAALATELETSRTTIWRRLRALEHLGLVRKVHLGREVHYETASVPRFSDAQYGALSATARTAAVAAALAKIQLHCSAALDAGGFDRSDIHLTRSTLETTEAAWTELTGHFSELLAHIDDAREPADPNHAADARLRVTAVLMLFEAAVAEPHHASTEHAAPLVKQAEIDRTYELHEALGEQLAGSSLNWTAIISIADELRIIAGAALATSRPAPPGGRWAPAAH